MKAIIKFLKQITQSFRNNNLRGQLNSDTDIIRTLLAENEELKDSLRFATKTGNQMIDSIERLQSIINEMESRDKELKIFLQPNQE